MNIEIIIQIIVLGLLIGLIPNIIINENVYVNTNALGITIRLSIIDN